MDTYMYVADIFDSSTSPGLWSIRLEHHTEISEYTNTNPIIEISSAGSYSHHTHTHTHIE